MAASTNLPGRINHYTDAFLGKTCITVQKLTLARVSPLASPEGHARGGAGTLIAEKVTLTLFTAGSPNRLGQGEGLVGQVKQVKH